MVICELLSNEEPSKCLEYAKKGYDLAQLVSDLSARAGVGQLERRFNDKIEELEQKIEYRYHNKFIFMDCDPFTRQASRQPGYIHLKKPLKQAVAECLASLQKQLVVKFETLDEENFKSIFSKSDGCKLLVIDFEQKSEDCGLLIEDRNLGEKIITKEEIEVLSSWQEQNKNIDILLIMNNQGKDYSRYFDRSNIKMIVYFDIPSNT